MLAPTLVHAQSIEVAPIDSRPSLVGPEQLFTGTAIIFPLFDPHGDSAAGGAEVRPGEVVWTPPNVEHWHGATPENAMTHTAIHEAVDGSVVEWLEPVSDEAYEGG